jgi:NAD(P)-dependent dehydrogenase (short-subunit alcohol dehydrogenase family)
VPVNITGNIALVTGGASGLGLATVSRLHDALVAHIVENPMLNGETIRLDGAIRMAPR